jgi:hypothetical protein
VSPLLQDIYFPETSSPDDLLEEAAAAAPVAAWRKAAAAGWRASGGCRGSNGSSGRDGNGNSSSSAGVEVRELQGSLRTLRGLTRKALRATAVATHLLQQQQQQGEDSKQQQGSLQPSSNETAVIVLSSSLLLPQQGHGGDDIFEQGQEAHTARRDALLNHLGMLLQDQAVCLGPWFEPWCFRPGRNRLRLLTLQAAEVGTAAPGEIHGALSFQSMSCCCAQCAGLC